MLGLSFIGFPGCTVFARKLRESWMAAPQLSSPSDEEESLATDTARRTQLFRMASTPTSSGPPRAFRGCS
ncbi:hypothetical protein MRX96_002048 [Rhipicephalus microplus]